MSDCLKCHKKCIWNMDGECVSENIQSVGEHKTYMTSECIGFLREDMIEHMERMKNKLLDRAKTTIRNCKSTSKVSFIVIRNYIVNMSYVDTIEMYERNFGSCVDV